MTETHTSGSWIVKSGEEAAFGQEWTAFRHCEDVQHELVTQVR